MFSNIIVPFPLLKNRQNSNFIQLSIELYRNMEYNYNWQKIGFTFLY